VPGSPKRLYISRSAARDRRISDESSLAPLLAEYGFTWLRLEQLAFRQQIELFANADVVCGLHGAGLANALFMRPESKMIEIFDPGYPEICWWTAASVSGIDYYYLLGEGPREGFADPGRNFELNHRDVVCDPDKLRATFELAGLRAQRP
jgi:capsular polysaccharide biosynthesis protein